MSVGGCQSLNNEADGYICPPPIDWIKTEEAHPHEELDGPWPDPVKGNPYGARDNGECCSHKHCHKTKNCYGMKSVRQKAENNIGFLHEFFDLMSRQFGHQILSG